MEIQDQSDISPVIGDLQGSSPDQQSFLRRPSMARIMDPRRIESNMHGRLHWFF